MRHIVASAAWLWSEFLHFTDVRAVIGVIAGEWTGLFDDDIPTGEL